MRELVGCIQDLPPKMRISTFISSKKLYRNSGTDTHMYIYIYRHIRQLHKQNLLVVSNRFVVYFAVDKWLDRLIFRRKSQSQYVPVTFLGTRDILTISDTKAASTK